jgi:hypothetical protein
MNPDLVQRQNKFKSIVQSHFLCVSRTFREQRAFVAEGTVIEAARDEVLTAVIMQPSGI